MPSSTLATTHFHLTGEGSGTNMGVTMVYQVNISAQGDISMTVYSVDISCQSAALAGQGDTTGQNARVDLHALIQAVREKIQHRHRH